MRSRFAARLSALLLLLPAAPGCSRVARCKDIGQDPTSEPIPESWRSRLDLSGHSRACGTPNDRVLHALEASEDTPAKRADALRAHLSTNGWEGSAAAGETRFELRRGGEQMKVEIVKVEGRIEPATLGFHLEIVGKSHTGPAF